MDTKWLLDADILFSLLTGFDGMLAVMYWLLGETASEEAVKTYDRENPNWSYRLAAYDFSTASALLTQIGYAGTGESKAFLVSSVYPLKMGLVEKRIMTDSVFVVDLTLAGMSCVPDILTSFQKNIMKDPASYRFVEIGDLLNLRDRIQCAIMEMDSRICSFKTLIKEYIGN